MSLYSIPARKHTAFYDNFVMPKVPVRNPLEERKQAETKETMLGSLKCNDRSADRSKEINRTYVIKSGGGRDGGTPGRGRLTLQKRKTGGGNTEKTTNENTLNPPAAPEKRLTLQRRTRIGSGDQAAMTDSGPGKAAERHRWASGTLQDLHPRTPGPAGIFRSVSLRDSADSNKSKEYTNSAPTPGRVTGRADTYLQKQSTAKSTRNGDVAKLEEQVKRSTPTRKTVFENISSKKDVFERLAGKEVLKAVTLKPANIDRSKTQVKDPQVTVEKVKPVATPRSNRLLTGVQKANPTSTLSPAVVKKTTHVTSSQPNANATSARSLTPAGGTPAQADVLTEPPVFSSDVLEQQDLKMENSAVTVAVRVRPFNLREKNEKALQVIFMDNQETVVHHPDSRQSYSFTYDFSFCSVDKNTPEYASQQTVFERLAKPLLERAFQGFNTCLFAYGQTGSGKSYTMMGFGEEAGVIPRFCEGLFSKLSSVQTQEVTCHLEMSYFEVYNEKIHDLLVAKDEQKHKSSPLRVREHPVHGPYVAELSTNVVTSYTDIQGWLELGNKQRATAATGMNDKSSRSHSVFTLVMTQTKTEFVEEEEHDHRITSRINLVDLAGSERCSSAQTSGDRLREGVSINKSLLTLGKVISALSEQAQTRRKVFTPYRESVLTWLLKESLGGNSKTAMIATVSPAGSNVEESLSTLRYAQQARTIINLAKVNEDTNAKLIRELKAEVEKLRAAQMSSQGVEPEDMKLFQQEIEALKSQLTQQEKDMAEAHRAWKEKLEQAEIRKREETKELQKAGITFKVNNRLPNLVNLNEDPQLSEMLLYMIKEGQTKVGQHKGQSAHDIHLTGALIADHHCVISNVSGTVSITPIQDAKTFVNGALISEPTVLHHGDRVILGGHHYFRFNHPAEVQSGKRVSCWTGSGDGQKDFEFAKNELLSAQRAQLEVEIEEARLKAKEEMMRGIQMAKELAQKELLDQKTLYENQINALQNELEEESERKRIQEQDQQRVASQMVELQSAKTQLEQEVDAHKRRLRLHAEAQAARQAMEDHSVRQAKIVDALEAEKKKISRDLEEMQRKLALRENKAPRSAAPQWDTMKLSLMIQEANKISDKLKKNTIFSRHESSEKENGGGQKEEVQVQVQNTKLGISTFWSLEKFQSSLAAMRDLDGGDFASKDDDVFYDPNDEWEQDISASSANASTFSRRRSRSMLKSRRISGRLYEIRVHPIQSLHQSSSQSSGLMGVSKPPSTNSTSADSSLPSICKDLIGQTVARLRGCDGCEESVADRLTSDLFIVHSAVRAIGHLYNLLDDDSQEKVFECNLEAQTELVKATSAVERTVFFTLQWLAGLRPTSGPLYSASEELKSQVKRMGGFFQLLIQGCDSEITSMVTEAEGKISQCLDAALRGISHLAALTGTQMHVTESATNDPAGKISMSRSLLEGTSQAVRSLLMDGQSVTKEMLREAQLAYPRTPFLQSLKSKTLDLTCRLQRYIHCNMTESEGSPEKEGRYPEAPHLHCLRNTAARLFQLNQAIRELHSSLSGALRGKLSDPELSSCRASILSSSRTISEVITGHPRGLGASPGLQMPCVQTVMAARDELHSALQSMCALTGQPEAAQKRGSAGSENNLEEGGWPKEGASSGLRSRAVPKVVYSLSSRVSTANEDLRWV